MNGNISILVQPASEPVTLAEMRDHLRLDTEGSPPTHPDDQMIEGQIVAARHKVEAAIRRCLVRRTLLLTMSSFPQFKVAFRTQGFMGFEDPDDYEYRDANIELRQPPVQNVESIQYYDQNNTLQTYSADNYLVDYTPVCPIIQLKEGQSWPSTYGRTDAVRITYEAGYAGAGSPADATSGIPEPIIEALKLEVQLLYDLLDPKVREQMQDTIRRLLATYKVHTF
jgi:hypothetical protein